MIERRFGIVLDGQLDVPGDLVAVELSSEDEREVDPGCDTGTGDSVPVTNNPFADRCHPEFRKHLQ